ncbi:(2Fe-2S) ferredoxin domain-containing protein [Candidatus Bipolaricaulota bacterium]|nr:(2Fe-2S) ferredoxin domain-containing protein [Candidatus Bipolaricaulota bacterium]
MKLEELRQIRERASKELSLRKGNARIKVVIGMGTSGIAAGARDVMAAFLDEISVRNLTDVVVTQTGERGLASSEPVVDVLITGEPKVSYGQMTADKARRVVVEHLVNGNAVTDFVIEVRG